MKKLLLLSILLCSPALAADISQTYKYQVLVKQTVNGNEYNDAIYYTPTEWANIKQADVNAEIQKRVTNYTNAINNPAPVVEATKVELQAQKLQLQDQIAQLDTAIAKAK